MVYVAVGALAFALGEATLLGAHLLRALVAFVVSVTLVGNGVAATPAMRMLARRGGGPSVSRK